MADLNEVRLIGRLTRDPDMKSIATGMAVATFGVATARKYKGNDGVAKEETTFLDITAWGKVAENVVKYFKEKGYMNEYYEKFQTIRSRRKLTHEREKNI